jgi:hypothetical protein
MGPAGDLPPVEKSKILPLPGTPSVQPVAMTELTRLLRLKQDLNYSASPTLLP